MLSSSLCHALRDKPVMTLTAVSAIVMTADGMLTAEHTRFVARQGLMGSYEIDPLTRVFIGSRPTWKRMAPAGLALIVAETALAERMHRSHTWLRKVWWLPQLVTIGANSWGVSTFLH